MCLRKHLCLGHRFICTALSGVSIWANFLDFVGFKFLKGSQKFPFIFQLLPDPEILHLLPKIVKHIYIVNSTLMKCMKWVRSKKTKQKKKSLLLSFLFQEAYFILQTSTELWIEKLCVFCLFISLAIVLCHFFWDAQMPLSHPTFSIKCILLTWGRSFSTNSHLTDIVSP